MKKLSDKCRKYKNYYK